MKKDFLTITPESGEGGTASVSAVADPNLLAKERSTTINFSATGGGGLSRAVTAIQDPAFAYQVHSNLILDNSFNKFKIENGVYLVPIDMNTTIGEKWKLVVYDPFSVITSITAKYYDDYGLHEHIGDDTFKSGPAGTGKVWYPQLLSSWASEFPGSPGSANIQLIINGSLAVKLYYN